MLLQTNTQKWGTALIFLITLSIVGAAFYTNWNSRIIGTVTVLVRDVTGAGSVESLSLVNGATSPTATTHEDVLASLTDRSFEGLEGSNITLSPLGVVQVASNGTTKTLIASAVPPPATTPLAVWNKGALIAWVNPSDQSLQVFSRSSRGVYLPVYASHELRINSIGFAVDHPVLVVTSVAVKQGSAVETSVFAIDFTGSAHELHQVITQSNLVTVVHP